MKTLREYPRLYIGKNNGERIFLSPPSWNCGWYWGFGYLGNKNCHYHVDGLSKDKNLFDAFKEHFGDSLMLRDSQLWTACELFSTFYILKETAEVLGRGGAHYTTNPCKDVIINTDETKRINEVVLPAVFDELYKVLERGQQKDKEDKMIIDLLVEGSTHQVYEYMIANKITTDDLKNIPGIISSDYDALHSYYWEQYHSKK